MTLLTKQLPAGTVLGGVDKPMRIDVHCQACGNTLELEYHDINIRWMAAAAGRPTEPAWREFDSARAVRPEETALDMSCSHCNRPIRVIIEADEWRMSIWAFYVTEVLALGF